MHLSLKSKFYESQETIMYIQSKVFANHGSDSSGFESLRAHNELILEITSRLEKISFKSICLGSVK